MRPARKPPKKSYLKVDMAMLGKMLILCGAILIIAGIIFSVSAKVPWLGRLPGDICIQKKNFTLYFPITTSIILSIILTIIFSLFSKK